MNTATITKIPKPTCNWFKVYFNRMSSWRQLFVEQDKLHLQMTFNCACDTCNRRECDILGSLNRSNIPYTVETIEGYPENERFVCFARRGDDPIQQVAEDTGYTVSSAEERLGITARALYDKRSSRNGWIGMGAVLAAALLGLCLMLHYC